MIRFEGVFPCVCSFGVKVEEVEPLLEGVSLQTCLENKKIYILDLRYMRDIECTEGRKVLDLSILQNKDNVIIQLHKIKRTWQYNSTI